MRMRLLDLQRQKKGQEVKVRGTIGGLGRHQAGVSLSMPAIRLKSYLLRVDKQASQPSPCRLLWYKKNSRADSQKVLLANVIIRR